jgi:CRP-like cAMP-binding protein
MSLLSPPQADRDALSRYLVAFPAGTTIYLEGEIGTDMYVVRSGQVEITRERAGESRVVARPRKGDFFGERSVLEDLPREATARARTDVEVIRVNGAALEAMLKSRPQIALRMMRDLSRRLQEAHAALEGPPARRAPETPPDADGDFCRLVSADGAMRFAVNRDGDTVIGRAGTVTQGMPDVDLTPLDPRRSVSRRHARLYRIEATTYVMEEIGAVNGTFVNDARLATGVPAAIHHGDVLKLGVVALTFWNPSV